MEKHTCMHVHAHAHLRDTETQKTVCLADFFKVNCRSEGVDLGYKSLIRVQVKAMKRN